MIKQERSSQSGWEGDSGEEANFLPETRRPDPADPVGSRGGSAAAVAKRSKDQSCRSPHHHFLLACFLLPTAEMVAKAPSLVKESRNSDRHLNIARL